MENGYFNDYFILERSHWWFRVREKILKNKIGHLINSKTDINILNVGAATGHTTEMLSNFGRVTSVEYNESVCNLVKTRLGIEMINASISELPFENDTFDVVCAFDVIEHIDDDQLGVNELIRVCKNKGYIVITVPTFQFLWSKHDVINHHKRRYRGSQLKRLFPNKKNIVFHSYFNFILFFFIAIYRIFSSKKKTFSQEELKKSDFSGMNSIPIINKILYFLFNIDYLWLKLFRLPFGVSYLLIYRKNDMN